MALFNGKAGCSFCHTPPLFIDNRVHALGVPQVGPLAEDLGRFTVTGDERDRSAFRTPRPATWRLPPPTCTTASSPPWRRWWPSTTPAAERVPGRSGPEIGRLHLSERERKALVAYLESLTDKTTDIRVPTVPAGS